MSDVKKTAPRVVTIGDIVQWNDRDELVISPNYQRRSVWDERAKAYLMDTIIRGLPIPPIFMRQEYDVNTKSTKREIIDGQQRVRAILEYVVDEKFEIKRSHNKEYGGKRYSDLDDEDKEAILRYEIVAEVVTEKNDSVIYDMFARLNSNSYVLNKQEVRNSKYPGEFKVFVYKLACDYRCFFLKYRLLSDKDCMRMKDADLINSMVILLLDGIVDESVSYVNKTYEKYNLLFNESEEIESRIGSIMNVIESVYDFFSDELFCLSKKNYFFTFYAIIANQMFGLKNCELPRNMNYKADSIKENILSLYSNCITFFNDYVAALVNDESGTLLKSGWGVFRENHIRRTTSKNERLSRISFLNKYFVGDDDVKV